MSRRFNHIQCAAIMFVTLFLYSYSTTAQVTIGSSLKPKAGALLDLKEYDSPTTTSTRGLGLPLVTLTANNSLSPIIGVQDETTEKEYIGLLLFNVGVENLESEESQLCKGLHVWNGKKWNPLTSYPKHIFGQNVIRCIDGPSFTVDCNSINVFGIYKKNVVLDASHCIEVTASFPADYIGKEYIFEAETTVNGDIKFSAKGSITNTKQVIRMQGEGKPTVAGSYDMKLVTNSSNSTGTSCSFSINVVLPKMRVVGVGAVDYHPASENNNSKSYVLMSNPKAFGTGVDAKVKVEGFKFENYYDRTNAEWISLLESKPDIIIRTYVSTMSNNAAVIAALKTYLDAGGVFLDFNDNNGSSSTAVKALYGNGASSSHITANTVTGQIHPFTDVNDAILNGPWLDLRNKTWSEDASLTQGITGVPEDRIIIYSRSTTNGQPVIAFRDKAVHYVYVGDGGFLSGLYNTNDCCYPFQLGKKESDPTTYNLPIMSSNNKGVMYNSHFFANLITWALKQAATNGINEW